MCRAMWLCGQYNFTLPTIIQLSKYLGTNGSYFLDFVIIAFGKINVAPYYKKMVKALIIYSSTLTGLYSEDTIITIYFFLNWE